MKTQTTRWTTRRILRHLRDVDPKTIYRTMADADGRRLIACKPDFDAVPYDNLHDYWHFVTYVDSAVSDLHLDA